MERGTIQYYTEAGLKEIKSEVLSLPGVTRCRLDADESGALQAIRVAVRSGWSPIHVAEEISSHLENTLEVELGPERVLIEVDESAEAGGAQGDFYGSSAGRSSAGAGESAAAAPPRPTLSNGAGSIAGRASAVTRSVGRKSAGVPIDATGSGLPVQPPRIRKLRPPRRTRRAPTRYRLIPG